MLPWAGLLVSRFRVRNISNLATSKAIVAGGVAHFSVLGARRCGCILPAVAAVAVIGCSSNSLTTPNQPSAVAAGDALIVPPSDQLTLIGGLSLDGYCQSLGHVNSTLAKSQIGPNAAFNNWRCQDADGGLHHFSMTRACQWQWGTKVIQAHPTDRDDAFTWVCYSPVRGTG